MRQIPLKDHDCLPQEWHLSRRRGRPRLQWCSSIFALALQLARGSLDELRKLLGEESKWKAAVKEFSI